MSEPTVSTVNDGTDGVYHAGEGQEFEVYGFSEEVQDLDGSMVEIDRAYEGGPRRQATLSPGERGNLVSTGTTEVTPPTVG